MKTTRAVDCGEFIMRVNSASMSIAAEKLLSSSATAPERAMANQMMTNAGRPPACLAWLVAAQPEVNDLISVD
ncbi:MAG: hypothetical protein J7474_12620, partial [Arthrobacter sp.]|nr:hypothetical protein [Arthrobacter sp.]